MIEWEALVGALDRPAAAHRHLRAEMMRLTEIAPWHGRARVPGNRWFDMDPEREPLEWELLRALARPVAPNPRVVWPIALGYKDVGLDPVVWMVGPWPGARPPSVK